MFNAKVTMLWIISIVESVLFALIPAALASSVNGSSFIAPLTLAFIGMLVMAAKNALDTRVYGNLMLDKVNELADSDLSSAKSKSERWSKLFLALETVVPNGVRSITDIVVALCYLLLVGGIYSGSILLLACVPLLFVASWVVKITKKVNEQRNNIAEAEGNAIKEQNVTEFKEIQKDLLKLKVKESDADAVLVAAGLGPAKLAELFVVFVVIQQGADTATAMAVYYYANRVTSSVDRLYYVVQQIVTAIIASKV